MMDVGDRVRVLEVEACSDVRLGTGLGTVRAVTDWIGAGTDQIIVELDPDALVWKSGKAYTPQEPFVFFPERLVPA